MQRRVLVTPTTGVASTIPPIATMTGRYTRTKAAPVDGDEDAKVVRVGRSGIARPRYFRVWNDSATT